MITSVLIGTLYILIGLVHIVSGLLEMPMH